MVHGSGKRLLHYFVISKKVRRVGFKIFCVKNHLGSRSLVAALCLASSHWLRHALDVNSVGETRKCS